MQNKSRDWTSYAPPGETQVPGFQTNGCGGYSTVHGCESQSIFYRRPTEWSERALVKLSGTNPLVGNTLEKEYAWVKENGLILASDWPQHPSMTRDEYYADVPQDLIDRSREAFFRDWEVVGVGYNVNPSDALLDAPLQVQVDMGNGIQHLVEGLSTTTAFDSLPHSSDPSKEWIVPYTTYRVVVNYNQIIIRPKMNTFVQTMNYNGTIGIFVPVSDPSQVPVLNSIFNTGIAVQPDGSIPTEKTVVDKQ